MMMRKLVLVVGLAALLPAEQARAGGFIVSEMDSEMAGRGNAAVALSTSPSAVFYNPASLTALEGLHVRAGMSFVFPRFRYESPGGNGPNSRTINQSSTPPNMSLSYALGDLGFGHLTGGLGVYVPYGASFRWPQNWSGRAEIQEIGLTVWEISPALALRVSEMFSVGVSLRMMPGDVYLRRGVQFGNALEGGVEMSGGAFETGLAAGITLWGFENLTLALTWRSPVTMRFRGQSDFDFPAPFDTEAVDRPVRARIGLPQVLRLGAVYQILPELNVSADIEMQQWSAQQKFPIKFENPDGTDDSQPIIRNPQDSITFHIGAEYEIFEGLAVRAGYVFDERTLPEETLSPAPPDSDRHVVSVGASYTWDKWLGFHLHYGNAFFVRRGTGTAPFTGTYSGGHGGETMAFIFGLNVSANFDMGPAFDKPLFGEGAATEAPGAATPDAAMPATIDDQGEESHEGHDHAGHDHAGHDHAGHDHSSHQSVDEAYPDEEAAPADAGSEEEGQ